ncbi:MAG: hypothetical protein Q4C10_10865, partial [Clostridia bacterium]|nr:hypothetical protein [Clostridia bacterium]
TSEPEQVDETPAADDSLKDLKLEESSDRLDENYEAWFKHDGKYACGKLADVLNAALGKDVEITLSAKKITDVRRIEKAALKQLSGITLKPSDDTFEIKISLEGPEGQTIELKDLSGRQDDERADLYIWLSKPEETPSEPEPEPEPEPTPAPVLSVAVEGKTGAEWSNEAPVFTLSGIPEGKAWSYAAVIYDERFVPLSDDTYTPEEEGVYTVRLVMLDELGDIVSASEKYTLWLDWTEPDGVSVRLDTETSYVVYLESSDAISGVEAISLDGGATWDAMTDGEEYRYAGSGPRTFAVGEIQVRDAAGNICPCEQEVELNKIEKENGGYYGGGGGGGSSGTGKPAKTHASGDGEDTGEYDALSLELPEEPMRQLTVDGETMALTLVLESAQEANAPVGQQRLFSAEWARWGGADDAEPDTLVLSAELDDNLGDSFTYAWHFNGEVYRMLSNSGIKYVALKVGDDIAAFPTEGFTGGTKYTELKMLGVSTRRFDYTLTMKVNLDPAHVTAMTDSDFSRNCDLSIRTEVENMSYELSSSPQSIMYFYDVYLGPGDMLNQPFGQYQIEAQ